MATPWRRLRVAPERPEALLQTGFLRNVRRKTVQDARAKPLLRVDLVVEEYFCLLLTFCEAGNTTIGGKPHLGRPANCVIGKSRAPRAIAPTLDRARSRYSILGCTLCLAEGEEAPKWLLSALNAVELRGDHVQLSRFLVLPSDHCHLSHSPVLSEPCEVFPSKRSTPAPT